MIEENREHKYRFQNGEAPDYKSLHEVRITKDCGYKTDGEIAAFVQKYIAAFNGHTEEKHGSRLYFSNVNRMHKNSPMN